MSNQTTNNTTLATTDKRTYRLNIGLIAVAVISMGSYIFFSNYALSERYSFNAMKHRVDQMVVNMNAQQGQTDDDHTVKTLMIFAQKTGMVEAKDTYSLFKDSGVALANTH